MKFKFFYREEDLVLEI